MSLLPHQAPKKSKASEGIARTEDSGRSFEERCLLVSS
jgi:hypothetical protein